MMDELKQELERLEKEREELDQRMTVLRKQIAERDAAFKPGDVIEGTIRGRTKRLRVNHAIRSMDAYKFRCVNIRKDGTEGATTILYPWDAEKYHRVENGK
jgi:hypothetical protein